MKSNLQGADYESEQVFFFFFRKILNLQYYCDAAISCTCSASMGALVC